MTNDHWELIMPGNGGKFVTILRKLRGDGLIYFRHDVAHELNIAEQDYCYIHQRGSKIMVSFSNEQFPGYRKIYHKYTHYTHLAGEAVLGNYMPKNSKRTVKPRIENGNINIDLRELVTADDKETT